MTLPACAEWSGTFAHWFELSCILWAPAFFTLTALYREGFDFELTVLTLKVFNVVAPANIQDIFGEPCPDEYLHSDVLHCFWIPTTGLKSAADWVIAVLDHRMHNLLPHFINLEWSPPTLKTAIQLTYQSNQFHFPFFDSDYPCTGFIC